MSHGSSGSSWTFLAASLLCIWQASPMALGCGAEDDAANPWIRARDDAGTEGLVDSGIWFVDGSSEGKAGHSGASDAGWSIGNPEAGEAASGGSGSSAGGSSAGGSSAGGSSAGGSSAGGSSAQPVNCAGIKSHPAFELCGSGANYCEGVFTNGAGCAAYCAAAGLTCTARYGGEPGCQGPELNNPLKCDDDLGHVSDWCHCEKGPGGVGGSADAGGSSPTCPGNPTTRSLWYEQAVYTPRSSWVLECRDYAYTAYQSEHEACDPQYNAGSGKGKAIFTFQNVPQGTYNVYFQGRHTANRNPAGALVIVSSGGQSWSKRIKQNDDLGIVKDLHGTYCLSGTVTVLLDSSDSSASDSVQKVSLEP